MKDFIELDGYCYLVTNKDWLPQVVIPSTVNFNFDGTLDATFGPTTVYKFDGFIVVRNTPIRNVPEPNKTWGTASNLETSLAKRSSLTLVIPTGEVFEVVANGYARRSLTPVWDGQSNVFYYAVSLLGRKIA